jgi:hypothetical protein
LRVLNHLFRGIVDFQWVDLRFVSPSAAQAYGRSAKGASWRVSGGS